MGRSRQKNPEDEAVRRGEMEDLRAEAELLLLAVGTRSRRTQSRPRMLELLERVDFEALAELGAKQRLLTLLGSRLESVAPELLPDSFSSRVQEAQNNFRLHSALQEHMTEKVHEALRAHGLRAVVLKGPSLGRRLYGDPSLRPSGDIDLLVAVEDFDPALRALRAEGYEHIDRGAWIGALPLFETSLVSNKQWSPPIDLHWRVHWHEVDFSRSLIARAPDTGGGLTVLEPVDEFATILLMYARDGFAGARGAADAAAWWDLHGRDAPEPALGQILEENPMLGPTLVTGAAVLDELVGIPSGQVVPSLRLRRRRSLATRLQNHSFARSAAEQEAATTLVDWLLTPKGRRRDFLRRHIFLPPDAIARAYGRTSPPPGLGWLLQLRYGAAILARLAPRWVSVLWRVRGGRSLVPPPSFRSSSANEMVTRSA